MHWIADDRYAREMAETAEPWLAPRRETGYDERVPGEPVYYEHYRADSPRGVIVISHGFTESIAKFAEAIYYMLQAGYEVWGVDHRGHGRSFRRSSSPLVVHVDHFSDYAEDLLHLIKTRIRPAAGDLPLYLFGHSMGGCIAAQIIEREPALFQKAVLSSPMFGLNLGKIPIPAAYLFALVKGAGNRGMEPLMPVRAEEERYEDSAGNCEVRFRWYSGKKREDVNLQTCAASSQWGREAVLGCRQATDRKQTGRIRIPVLVLQAGNDTYVDNAAQDRFCSQVPSSRLVRLGGMRHELYMCPEEKQIEYWERIFAFLEE